MTERKKINILIDGRNFTVVGSDNEDYVKTLGVYVDKKIKDLTSKNDRLCQTMAATLAALNIADELYKNKSKLEELEYQAKDPMERYGNVIEELKVAKATIETLETQCKVYKEDLMKSRIDSDYITKEAINYEEALALKEKELENSLKTIKALQDKVFNNQIELIETKKELGEVIKRLDSEKNIFAKEEI